VATSTYHNFFYEFIKETLEEKGWSSVPYEINSSTSST
jgi:hypothetical protein